MITHLEATSRAVDRRDFASRARVLLGYQDMTSHHRLSLDTQLVDLQPSDGHTVEYSIAPPPHAVRRHSRLVIAVAACVGIAGMVAAFPLARTQPVTEANREPFERFEPPSNDRAFAAGMTNSSRLDGVSSTTPETDTPPTRLMPGSAAPLAASGANSAVSAVSAPTVNSASGPDRALGATPARARLFAANQAAAPHPVLARHTEAGEPDRLTVTKGSNVSGSLPHAAPPTRAFPPDVSIPAAPAPAPAPMH